MATLAPVFEDVLDLVKQLTPGQKLRLIEAVIPDLEASLQQVETDQKPLRSLYGLWKDLKSDVSADDIDDARKEMWGTFPREDV
jgi:hypothetical protein